MIWPFKRALAIEAPTEPVSVQAMRYLNQLQEGVLAFKFTYTDRRDRGCRGIFKGNMERLLALAPTVDWESHGGRWLLAKISHDVPYLLERMANRELSDSFAGAFSFTNVDSYLSPFHAHMKELKPLRQIAPAGTSLTFPAFTYPNEKLKAQLVSLSQQWRKRAGQQLSVEDRYFVDAMVKSYLPDSIALLSSLREDPKLSKQAEAMFMQQVQMLHERLAAIEDHSGAKQLEAMEVHSAFLKERLVAETKPSKRLQLNR